MDFFERIMAAGEGVEYEEKCCLDATILKYSYVYGRIILETKMDNKIVIFVILNDGLLNTSKFNNKSHFCLYTDKNENFFYGSLVNTKLKIKRNTTFQIKMENVFSCLDQKEKVYKKVRIVCTN